MQGLPLRRGTPYCILLVKHAVFPKHHSDKKRGFCLNPRRFAAGGSITKPQDSGFGQRRCPKDESQNGPSHLAAEPFDMVMSNGSQSPYPVWLPPKQRPFRRNFEARPKTLPHGASIADARLSQEWRQGTGDSPLSLCG